VYAEQWKAIAAMAPKAKQVVDACNLMRAADVVASGLAYVGIGRGREAPSASLVEAVYAGFRAVETGAGNEVAELVRFLNGRYAPTQFNKVQFSEVQRIAATCPTGCAIVDAGATLQPPASAFRSQLVQRALGAVAAPVTTFA